MKKKIMILFMAISFFCGLAEIPVHADSSGLDNEEAIRAYEASNAASLRVYMNNVSDDLPESIRSFIDYLKDKLSSLARVAIEDRLARSLTYNTTDAHGNTQQVSGLICAPNESQKKSYPIVMYQHPTQVERMYSPSHVSANALDDQLSWFLADLMRICGFIVLAPDYPGMGINMDVHPYCHKSIANSVVDMIPAAVKFLKEVAPNIEWNGNVYLIGFSEGGYATMVAAKKIQAEYSSTINVRGIHCLDAPLSLSGTMRDVMLNATPEYDAPYFLPYFIAAYADTYKNIPEFAFDNCIRNDVHGFDDYPAAIKARLNGNYKGGEISEIMMKATPYVGPRSVMTPAIISELEDTESSVYKTLSDNNAYEGYKPEPGKLQLYHNIYDDYVPVGNSKNAVKYFYEVQDQVVSLMEFEPYIKGLGSVHAGAFPIAFSMAFYNIYMTEYNPF